MSSVTIEWVSARENGCSSHFRGVERGQEELGVGNIIYEFQFPIGKLLRDKARVLDSDRGDRVRRCSGIFG